MLGDLQTLIQTIGLLGIIGMIFAETGLLFGFFLPGDSLLFTAGFLASHGVFPLVPLVIGTVVAAIVGDSTGYWIGRKAGTALYARPDSAFFKQAHLTKARAFYAKYGPRTVIIARFIPVIRAFGPVLAGVSQMHYPTYLTFSVIGSLLWAGALPLLGYYLGSVIPNVDRYILPIVLLIIIVSIAPAIKHVWSSIAKSKSQRAQ
ncbi:DedA family protein [Candidatus Berkelbacteria bacterium]|nr:DedA family protein [Candidatus Berkelbacteria bacterium]